MIEDSMFGAQAQDVERWSPLVTVVRGLNPGPFTGPGTNTYLLGRSSRPLLLDTGAGIRDYVALLASTLRNGLGADAPGDMVITHAHPDHMGGAASVIERFGPRRVMKLPSPREDGGFAVRVTSIDAGEVIRGDGVTLRAIHTPGHARDHLCFYLEEERALFSGDVILGAGTTVIPLLGGDMAEYLKSLRCIVGMDLERIYPGHGPLITDPHHRVRGYIDHRHERERQIVAAIDDGVRTVERMVERIYVDTPRVLYPAAGQSVLSHLLKLEKDGRVVRETAPSGDEEWRLT